MAHSTDERIDVFISYHHSDRAWAQAVHTALTLRGFNVWVDFSSIRAGDIFAATIEHAISRAANVIILYSPESMSSRWVKQEYYTLLSVVAEHPPRIIPVLIGNTTLPAFLQTRQYVDWRDASPETADMSQIEWAIRDKTPRHKRLTIRHIHDETELAAVWRLDRAAYGSLAEPLDTLRSWWEAFPSGIYGLFFDDSLIGAVGVWPVSANWIRSLASGHVSELSLPVQSLARHKTRPSSVWYIAGVALLPIARTSSATAMLLRQGIALWARSPLVQYPCSLYAIAASREGQALLTRFAFTCLQPGSHLRDGKPLYAKSVNSATEVSRALKMPD
jgi:hypothetical protein